MKYVINELASKNQNYLQKSTLNLIELNEGDNGVEFKFTNSAEVVYFELKPKSVRVVQDFEKMVEDDERVNDNT